MDSTTLGLMLLQVTMILLLAGVVLEMIIAVYLAKIYRKMNPQETTFATSEEAIPPIAPPPVESAVLEREPLKDTELLQGHPDMTASIQALASKYGMEAFTLATQDGLVVASSTADGQEDAATYSHLFTNGENSGDPRVHLFGIHHQGSPMVGIIKANRTMQESWVKSVEDDLKNILDRWL